MKREILFRGLSNQGKGWLYGDVVRNVEGAVAIMPPYQMNMDNTCSQNEVNPDTIGQYTRLKDKNRKKIFEWDILFQGQELLGVVCVSKRYGVSILKKTTTWSLINFVLDSDFDAGVLSDIEVRGNIYDNPELMKAYGY